MNSTYIWVFDLADKYLKNELIIIEIYVARNKFTKKGLFSGPLRKKEINNYIGHFGCFGYISNYIFFYKK